MSRDHQFGRKSILNLHGVHPKLILVSSRALLYSHYDFMITEGLRDIERQQILVSNGWSDTLKSMHLKQSDGWAHAVDFMLVGDLNDDGDVDAQDRAMTWNRDLYTATSHAWKKAARELGVGIRWGGDFKTRFDGPHVELYG